MTRSLLCSAAEAEAEAVELFEEVMLCCRSPGCSSVGDVVDVDVVVVEVIGEWPNCRLGWLEVAEEGVSGVEEREGSIAAEVELELAG